MVLSATGTTEVRIICLLCGECPSLLTVCVISEVDDYNGWLFSEAVAGC